MASDRPLLLTTLRRVIQVLLEWTDIRTVVRCHVRLLSLGLDRCGVTLSNIPQWRVDVGTAALHSSWCRTALFDTSLVRLLASPGRYRSSSHGARCFCWPHLASATAERLSIKGTGQVGYAHSEHISLTAQVLIKCCLIQQLKLHICLTLFSSLWAVSRTLQQDPAKPAGCMHVDLQAPRILPFLHSFSFQYLANSLAHSDCAE